MIHIRVYYACTDSGRLVNSLSFLCVILYHNNIIAHALLCQFREAVFADPRTLISRNALDRELEQAVRFLHDNGTMLHYEDPLLSDLYFVDPQWLCDMLAHIVTVREINPLVRDGKFINLFISCSLGM